MNTYSTLLFFASLLWSGNLLSQSCLGTVDLEGKIVCVKDIVSLESAVESTHLKDSLKEAGDVALFHRYFHTMSYIDYKNLFIASEWFGLPEDEYVQWGEYLKGKDVQIESIVRFENAGVMYSSIQYFVIADGVYDRAAFLCKKINQYWYPTSEEDDDEYEYETSFFRRIRPQFLEYLLSDKEVSPMRNHGKAASLRAKAVSGTEVNAYPLMVDRHSISSYKAEEYHSLYYNLSELVNPEAMYAEDRSNDSKFISYMDSLKVPEMKKTEILGLIQNFQYLKTAARLSAFQGSEYNTTIHTSAINRIYGSGRVFEFVAKTENE